MNCTTCRYELSQCLDGRLPSGRRTEVMNHAESCATCGSFWLELQAAQKLSLSLQQSEVSPNFREGLWDRIHAGEGTPSAVFQEQVPMWSKVRYTLTGAAAAAALLIGVTFLMKDDVAPNTVAPNTVASNNSNIASNDGTASNNTNSNGPVAIGPDANGFAPSGGQAVDLASNGGYSPDGYSPNHGTLEPRRRNQFQLSSPPLMAAAKRLSTEVLAVETARQLEQRYATAAVGLRMMHNPANNRAHAVTQVIESADEMRDFIEVLLDLRDTQGLFFTDAGIDADLQFAVKMLEQAGTMKTSSEQAVEMFIEPVLSKSNRLAHVSRSISLKPTTNIYTERSYLQRVNTMRPEVFRKLFVVLGSPDQMRPGAVFLLEGDCEMGWVAPISEINAHMQRIEIDLRTK